MKETVSYYRLQTHRYNLIILFYFNLIHYIKIRVGKTKYLKVNEKSKCSSLLNLENTFSFKV